MRVLHLSPPNPTTTNVLRDGVYGCWCKGKRIGGAKTPPQPLVSVATTLKAAGHHVTVIDAANQGIGVYRLCKRLDEFDAVVVLASVMTFQEDSQVLEALKRVKPELLTIVAGAMPTFMPNQCLESLSVDVIIQNEEELAIRDLLALVEKGGDAWKQAKGIGYRDADGKPVLLETYPSPQILDEIPITDWTLLPRDVHYFYPLVKRYPFVSDLTTRGCPKRCSFCMAPGFYGNKVRGRSAEHIIRGFELYRKQGYREIYLKDEMFTTLRKRNDEIFDWLINKNIDLTWLCSAAIGWMDKPLLQKMKRAGCHTIKIGVESGVQHLLDRVNKGIKLEQTEETFRWTKEVGMHTHAHLMIGLPGETEETIEETIRFVKRIEPTTVSFGIMTPYPGTPIFEEVAEMVPELRNNYRLRLQDLHDKSYFSDRLCALSDDRLAFLQKKAHRDFYWRPEYLWGWIRRTRDFDTLKTVARAGFNVLNYSVFGD